MSKPVLTPTVKIIYDGINNPDKKDPPAIKYNLKVAVLVSDPAYPALEAEAMRALTEDPKFKGSLPAGGVWPFMEVADDVKKHIGGGYVCFNVKTQMVPNIFGEDGLQIHDPMSYSPKLFSGAEVRLLVHAYSFDNKSRGVAFSLDGVQIVNSSATRLPFGGALSATEAAAAFQAAPVVGAPAPQAAVGAPISAEPAFVKPAAPQMTAKAQHTYEQYKASNWTDEQLKKQGLMV